ncbi:hypothetical protein VNO78_10074 [Psophocarpus tetragonolobus]|uniref:Uncharacterized protein n=1 Tax=Psophocarpus tetragonolobus TaxID=3891 RepID=A0AAN9SJ75_PSOTE
MSLTLEPLLDRSNPSIVVGTSKEFLTRNQGNVDENYDRLLGLNLIIAKIFFELSEWMSLPPNLLDTFLEFFENALVGKFGRAGQPGKAVWEEHLVRLLPFILKFLSHGTSYWTSRLLQAFTETFRESKPGSLLKLACLSAIEDMLTPIQNLLSMDETSNLENLELQDNLLAWIRYLPLLLFQFGNKHPSCSQVVVILIRKSVLYLNFLHLTEFWESNVLDLKSGFRYLLSTKMFNVHHRLRYAFNFVLDSVLCCC